MAILYPKQTAKKIDLVLYTTAIMLLCLFPPIIVPFLTLLLKPTITFFKPLVVQSNNKYVKYLVDEYNFYVFYSKVQSKIGKK